MSIDVYEEYEKLYKAVWSAVGALLYGGEDPKQVAKLLFATALMCEGVVRDKIRQQSGLPLEEPEIPEYDYRELFEKIFSDTDYD